MINCLALPIHKQWFHADGLEVTTLLDLKSMGMYDACTNYKLQILLGV